MHLNSSISTTTPNSHQELHCKRCGLLFTEETYMVAAPFSSGRICRECQLAREVRKRQRKARNDRKYYIATPREKLRAQWRKRYEREKLKPKTKRNRPNRPAAQLRDLHRIKEAVLARYSCGEVAVCVKCGFSDIRALSIDHVNGGGTKHRRELKGGYGRMMYVWLRRNGYPSGYQTLCMNCQFIKRFECNEQGRHLPIP